jgi:hypothetical protein
MRCVRPGPLISDGAARYGATRLSRLFTLSPPGLDVGAQDRVHAGLIAAALRAEPGGDVLADPYAGSSLADLTVTTRVSRQNASSGAARRDSRRRLRPPGRCASDGRPVSWGPNEAIAAIGLLDEHAAVPGQHRPGRLLLRSHASARRCACAEGESLAPPLAGSTARAHPRFDRHRQPRSPGPLNATRSPHSPRAPRHRFPRSPGPNKGLIEKWLTSRYRRRKDGWQNS